jgi:hypothetical protein
VRGSTQLSYLLVFGSPILATVLTSSVEILAGATSLQLPRGFLLANATLGAAGSAAGVLLAPKLDVKLRVVLAAAYAGASFVVYFVLAFLIGAVLIRLGL